MFSGISVFYLLIGAYILYQLVTRWREFWSDEFAQHPKTQQLASGVSFFLLVPIGVLLHEIGHMVAAWLTGSEVLGLHYFVYWGYVSFIPARPDPVLLWFVALAGNFVSYALGIVCVAAALMVKMKPILRVVLYQLGMIELIQTLVAYPLMSLDPNFNGDWDTIYSFQAPVASWATLVVHMLSLVAFVVLVRRSPFSGQPQRRPPSQPVTSSSEPS